MLAFSYLLHRTKSNLFEWTYKGMNSLDFNIKDIESQINRLKNQTLGNTDLVGNFYYANINHLRYL